MTKSLHLPYILSFLIINPFAISQSLQFSTIYYIYTLASIIYLLKSNWFEANNDRLILYFTLIGCLTSYFDFLTYPLVSYGIPATIILCKNKKPIKNMIKMMFLMLIFWGIGYIGMWSGKWIIGTVLGNENIIMNAIGALQERSSMQDASGSAISLISIIILQLYHFKNPVVFLLIFYTLIVCIMNLKKYRYNFKEIVEDYTWIIYRIMCFTVYMVYCS